MGKLVKLSDEVYEFLKREQKRLSKEKLRHVSFSEVIAYLANRDTSKILLERTTLEREKHLEELRKMKEEEKARKEWEDFLNRVFKKKNLK